MQPSMLPDSAATTDGRVLPKYARVAAALHRQITDGTLRPGQPAPSGAALSRVTGYSTLTCRRALRVLVDSGVLTPGPSRNARPRVAGIPQQPAERDLAAAARALSAGLASRRRADGLTQPELALRAEVSVTTIGHAETGRLWQSRQFWERADEVLLAYGDLLRLHDAYREAGAANTHEPGPPPSDGGIASDGRAATRDRDAAGRVGEWRRENGWPDEDGQQDDDAPASVTIVWGNGAVTTVRRPQPPVSEPPVSELPVSELPVSELPGQVACPSGAA